MVCGLLFPTFTIPTLGFSMSFTIPTLGFSCLLVSAYVTIASVLSLWSMKSLKKVSFFFSFVWILPSLLIVDEHIHTHHFQLGITNWR